MKPGRERGISTVVGEVLLVAVAAIAMSALAWTVVSNIPPPVRHPTLEVRLENASHLPTDSIAVVLFHMGGDVIGIPNGPNDEFRVQGGHTGTGQNPNSWDNVVPWDSWVFSDPEGLKLGEYAVGFLKYTNAKVNIGDKLWIAVTDLYSDTLIFRQQLTVENSLLVYG